jgi:hypothetical protein
MKMLRAYNTAMGIGSLGYGVWRFGTIYLRIDGFLMCGLSGQIIPVYH